MSLQGRFLLSLKGLFSWGLQESKCQSYLSDRITRRIQGTTGHISLISIQVKVREQIIPANFVVNKLNISHKSSLLAKVTNTMGCIRNIASMLSKVFLHLYSWLVRNIWSARSSLDLPTTRKIWDYCSNYNKEPGRWLGTRGSFIWGEAKRPGHVQPRKEKA